MPKNHKDCFVYTISSYYFGQIVKGYIVPFWEKNETKVIE